MALQSMLRKMRLSLARLPPVGYGKLPLNPAYFLRDLWNGDSIYGMHLTKGELIYKDYIIPLQPGLWGKQNIPVDGLCKIYDFSWLRDLREFGTDNARLCARALIVDWMSRPPNTQHKVAYRGDILGKRLTNWLGHYDFFASSADKAFKQQFLHRVMIEGRYITAMLPPTAGSHYAFAMLKGVMAVSLCLPEQFDLSTKITRCLKNELANQILEDGVHIERNAEIQLMVLQDLVEIKLMYQLTKQRPPNELTSALDNLSRALRALRHGDGGLALFNGSNESNPQSIDRILFHATQKRVAMTNMTKGGYIRCYANRATLLVDSGTPADIGRRSKHAGCLSLEFSVGKQRVFVNCGAGETKTWRSILGCTAAHSVLDLNGTDSVEFVQGKVTPHFEAVAKHHMEEGAHLLEMGHNGWLKRYGVIYQRIIYLSSNGQILKGEERIDGPQQYPFMVRFHLHPSIVVEEDFIEFVNGKPEHVYALMANNPHEGRQIWWFRFSGANARIEESVYFGSGSRVLSKQIVLYVTVPEKKNKDEVVSVQTELLSKTDETHKVDTQTVLTEQPEESSDYVAIFHNKNNDQGSGQESDPALHSETVLETTVPQETVISEPTKNHEKEKHALETDNPIEEVDAPQIVRWALHRKL
ncbi:heparinase II/III family protein [Commensalibacter communis]|uniref:heparinase II/III family protein n=1 Tax=Commensalibacter communis TaxID=2972786 RepID=UPI00232DFA88|nr:heparinase II/III family protein [Commensalibacter communis]